MMVTVFSMLPNNCSSVTRAAFQRIVEEGDAVDVNLLKQGIERAELLAFAQKDGEVVAVAAIKNPLENYRRRCFAKAEADVDADNYIHELGWISVCPNHRRQGISKILVEHLLGNFSENLFATSLDPNVIRILCRNGFSVCGKKYKSKEHPGEYLQLLIRHL